MYICENCRNTEAVGSAVGFWLGGEVLVVLSDWAVWSRSWALWTLAGTVGGLPPPCLSNQGATGLSSGCCLACSHCERVSIIQMGHILVQVLVLVAGSVLSHTGGCRGKERD